MNNDQYFTIIAIILVLIGVFLLFREFWCWYWKINERRDLQKSIIEQLKKLNSTKSDRSTNNNSYYTSPEERTHEENILLANKIAKERKDRKNEK